MYPDGEFYETYIFFQTDILSVQFCLCKPFVIKLQAQKSGLLVWAYAIKARTLCLCLNIVKKKKTTLVDIIVL